MNLFQLVAQVAEREMLRYTPAGIPIVSAKLAHSSQQMEARVQRLVEFEISALAAGEISGRLNQLEPGKFYLFSGFMVRKNRNSKSLIFHLTDIGETTVAT
jgi:primosomal replication protein N